MRVVVALPLCGLAALYVGLSISFQRRKTSYLTARHQESVRQARCFTQDVGDYAVTGDAHDGTITFSLQPVGKNGTHETQAPPVSVSVPIRFFDTAGLWTLETLYDLYAHLAAGPARTADEEALLRDNLGEALRAVLEHRLAGMGDAVSDAAVAVSPEEACNTMAIATLAQRLPIPVRLNASVYRAAKAKFARDGSTGRSVVEFARALMRTCGWRALAASSVMLLCQSTLLEFLSPAYQVAVTTMCFAELVRRQAVLPADGVLWGDFVVSMILSSESPGQLLAATMLLDAVRTLISTAKDAVGNVILHTHNDRLREAAILAVSRMDYSAESDWPVPQRVYGALSSVTNFTFRSVDYWVGSLLERVDLWLTCGAHPVEAAVLWVVQQALVRVETLVGKYDNLIKHMRTRAPTAEKRTDSVRGGGGGGGGETSPSPPEASPHYGLTLLLSVGDGHSAPVLWQFVATTARLPHRTEMDRRLTLAALAAVRTESHSGLAQTVRRLSALLTTSSDDDLSLEPSAPLIVDSRFDAAGGDIGTTLLHVSRQHGLISGDGRPLLLLSPARDDDDGRSGGPLSAETTRAVVDRLLQSCDSLPVLALLLLGTRASDGAPPAATAASLERLLQTAATSDRPFVFGSYSPFAYDVQSLQFAYWSRSDYTQSMQYLSRLIATAPAIDRGVGTATAALEPGPWSLTFQHVWFRYPGQSTEWALKDVSFTLPAGEFLGIIGYSGAGKTSVLLLVMRLYAPTRGAILLNGRPLECFPARALRRHIAHSWQAAKALRFLEECTIETNIALGQLEHANDASIRAALARACAVSFVESRARGVQNVLDTEALSGGEVERLSLARTFMKHPERGSGGAAITTSTGLVLLDECTSALDSSTEEAVLEPLLRTTAPRPTSLIMVTHRLSSIRGADLILVLDQGRVAEQGSWSDLVAAHERATAASPTLFGTLLVSQGHTP